MSFAERLVSIVALLGWLVLAVSGFAAFRLNWGKTVKLALVWAAIIVGVTLFIAAVHGQ